MPRLILDELQKTGPTLVLDEPSSTLVEETGPHLVLDDTVEKDEQFSKMSPLNKTLDIIGRPGYAFRSLISQIQDETKQSIDKIDEKYGIGVEGAIITPETQRKMEKEKKMAILSTKPQVMERLNAVWRGLSGKERLTGNQLWEKVGVKGVPLLGFATDVATDPLMYGGYSAITKGVGKIAGKVGETSMKVPAIKTLATTVSESAKPWMELISTKSPIPAMNDMIDKWLSERQFLKGREIQYAAQTRLAVKSIARKMGVTPKEIGQRTANIIELRYHPEELAKVVPNILPEERALANTLQSHWTSQIVDEMKRGVPISPLSSVRDTKVAKLRKNLEVIRTGYGTELARTRAQLVKELDVYGDQKLGEVTNKLIGAKEKIEDAAYRSHLDNVKRLNTQIDSIDGQMRTLEELRLKVAKGGGRALSVEADIQKTQGLLDRMKLSEEGGYAVEPKFTGSKVAIGEGKVEMINVSDTPSRARVVGISKEKWDIMATDIKTNGVKVPIIIDKESGMVLDGHTRLTIAEDLGIKKVPVVYVDKSNMDKTDITALNKQLTEQYNPKLSQPTGVVVEKGIRPPNKSVQGLLNRKRLLEQNLSDLQSQSTKPLIEIDKQLSKLENQFWYLHSEMADRLQDIPELAKGSLYIKQIDDISKLLSADIEVNLGGRGVSLAKQIMAAEEKVGKLPHTPIGIPTGESRKLLKQLTIERAKREFGYFPRITTDDAKKILLSMRIGRTKLWTPQMMNALKRRTEDFTLDEFNSFVNGFGLKSLEGKTLEQFFLTDPSYISAVRGTRGAKAITSAEFLRETGEKFGLPIADAPSTYIQLPENVIKLNPSLKGLVFPNEVAAEIGRASEYYMNPSYRPEVWDSFVKHFDQVQNVWKRWQLAVFPKYHLRNMVGNMWNNFLADVSVEYYPKASALQAYRKYGNIPYYGDLARKGLRTLGISIEDANKLILDAERLGVLEHGWYASDIDLSIRQAMGGKGGISGRGMLVGRTIENNARLAHFMDRVVGRGKSVEEAALSVKKYLFDYGDLTHFERTVMKRLMPFYTWTRKNIPLQLESLLKTPEKFAPLAIPIRNREPIDLLRLKYTNNNLYQRLPLELQRTIDTVTYIPLEGILPAADLAKIARPQDILFDLLSPFVKEPAQQAFNKDIYFDQPIQRYKGENAPFLGADIPVRIRHLLTTVSPGARITRELDGLVTKKKNKLPLTPAEWAFASTLSTVYKSDLKDLRRRALTKTMGDIKELTMGAANAKRNGREEEFKSIKNTLDNVVKDMKGIR